MEVFRDAKGDGDRSSGTLWLQMQRDEGDLRRGQASLTFDSNRLSRGEGRVSNQAVHSPQSSESTHGDIFPS